MNAVRTGAFVVIVAAVLVACTFTRDLDYLTKGDNAPIDGSSSSGDDAGPGEGVEIVSKQPSPTNLKEDGDFLYWSNDNNQIMRVAKAGGEAKELVKIAAADVGAIVQLAIDPSPAGNIFVLLESSIKTVPKEGAAAATDWKPTTTATAIAVDDTFVFTTETDEGANATLVRYPKANAAEPTVIGPPAGKTASAPGALVLFTDSVYWVFSDDEDAVPVCHQVPKTAPAMFATPTVWKHLGKSSESGVAGIAVAHDYELAVDQDGLYWVDDNDYIPFRLKRDATQMDAVSLLNKTSSATSIGTDATSIYVLTTDKIVKVTKSDGNRSSSYAVDTDTAEFVNDAKNLYYIFPGDDVTATGGIRRIAK